MLRRWGRRNGIIAALLAATVLLAGCGMPATHLALAEDVPTVPAALIEEPAGQAESEVAILAGGCFWGVQGVFQHVTGVTQAVSGYAGGKATTAQYELVSSGATGHAESVQITFNPQVIGYSQLLQIYFSVAHDPTELNRQGPDVGTQYRSAIFYHDDEQRAAAIESKRELDDAGTFGRPIVTEIVPASEFYRAEEYHQRYYERLGIAPHCGVGNGRERW
jgi:peptide-methionine (S)-S-oxide reductase